MATKREYKFTVQKETGHITVETIGQTGPKCVDAVEEIKVAIGGTTIEDTKTGDYWKKPDPSPNFQFGK